MKRTLSLLKWIILGFGFLIILTLVSAEIVKITFGFHSIERNSVVSAVIYKNTNINQSKNDSIILNKNKLSQLIYGWNFSYPVGWTKYFPQYILKINLKNGKTRHFKISGKNIKEDSDFTFRQINQTKF